MPSTWLNGDIILGLYSVHGLVGSSNFGTTHRVYHLNWRTDLVVESPSEKTLANKEYLRYYLEGAEVWANMCFHPNIVTCFYIRELGGIPRIFMEYGPGGSLGEKIAECLELRGTRVKSLARLGDSDVSW